MTRPVVACPTWDPPPQTGGLHTPAGSTAETARAELASVGTSGAGSASTGVGEPGTAAHPWRTVLLRILREALLIGALLAVYRAARLLTADEGSLALRHARQIWDLQQHVPLLPSERAVQALALQVPGAGRVANIFYASVHFPLTSLTLAVLLLSGSPLYRRLRNALGLTTAAALVIHLLLPVAPPRMLPMLGFVDTGRLLGPAVYSAGQESFVNQFAAMPSLHVAWALLVALALATATRSRWRVLWYGHPLLTLLVVVVTANHFWSDALVGAALAWLAWLAAGRLQPAAGPDRSPAVVRGNLAA